MPAIRTFWPCPVDGAESTRLVSPDLRRHREYFGDVPTLDFRVLDVGQDTAVQREVLEAAYPGIQVDGIEAPVRDGPSAAADYFTAFSRYLPFPDDSFHYISVRFSYDMIADRVGLFSDLFRLLRPGGCLGLIALAPRRMRKSVLWRYFPEARMLDYQHYLRSEPLCHLLSEAGFNGCAMTSISAKQYLNLARLHAAGHLRHFTPGIEALPDAVYARGAAKVLADAASGIVTHGSDVAVYQFSAEKHSWRD